MKKTLLSIFTLLSVTLYSQTPIASYFGTNDYNYSNLNPASPLSHATMGANVSWTFNSLAVNGSSVETNVAPTPSEITTYPNTTSVHNVSTDAPSPSSNAKIYNRTTGTNVFSFTGFDANGIILNYSTNNATLGTFPLNYSFSNNDTTGGTFIYGANSGTFTGTINTDYDAYGTLNLNVTGFDPIVKSVFRVRVSQNMTLSVGFPVGTVVQTTYTYYVNEGGSVKPFFKDTTYTVNVALLGINQTTNQAQVFTDALTLGTTDFEIVNSIKLFPNPTQDILKINNESNVTINSVSITDNNGRVVLETSSFENYIDVRGLQKGIYFVKIATDKGTTNQKMIKN
jgi:Secretion system C-terminal sorting domain